MKLLSRACAKQKTKRLNGFKFRILLVIFKWHYDGEGVQEAIVAKNQEGEREGKRERETGRERGRERERERERERGRGREREREDGCVGRDEHLIDGYITTQVHIDMDDLLHTDSSSARC